MSYRQKIVHTQNKYANPGKVSAGGVSKTRGPLGSNEYQAAPENSKRERRVSKSKGRDGSIELTGRMNGSVEKSSKTPMTSGPVSNIFGRISGNDSTSMKTSTIIP